jgi:chromate transport protein ChrA
MCCCYMIVEPHHLKRAFEKRNKLYHLMPALIMLLALAMLIQTHIEREQVIVKFVRGMTFAVLSIVWVYIVGINQSQSIEPLRDNSSHFLCRFAPILYCPAWLAILFFLAGVMGLMYQYYTIYIKPGKADQLGDVDLSPLKPAIVGSSQSDPMDDLEMFRQARLAHKESVC